MDDIILHDLYKSLKRALNSHDFSMRAGEKKVTANYAQPIAFYLEPKDELSLKFETDVVQTYNIYGLTEERIRDIIKAIEFSEEPTHPELRRLFTEYKIMKELYE